MKLPMDSLHQRQVPSVGGNFSEELERRRERRGHRRDLSGRILAAAPFGDSEAAVEPRGDGGSTLEMEIVIVGRLQAMVIAGSYSAGPHEVPMPSLRGAARAAATISMAPAST